MTLVGSKLVTDYIKTRTAEDLARRYEVTSGGIYAWHIPAPSEKLKLNLAEINEYYTSVSDAISKEYAETARSRVTISINKTPIESSPQAQECISTIRSFLDLVGIFSCPVYVGMTADQGISERIRQHLVRGAFNDRMMAAIQSSGYSDNIYLEAMLVRYFPVDDFLAANSLKLEREERVALIEQIEKSIFACRMPSLNKKRSR